MKSLEEAKELAETMVEIGKALGKKTIAIITDMNQPLGHEVGNANEVREVIEILKGNGCEDETVIALTITSYMAILGGIFPDFETAYSELEKVIKSGKAFEKLKEFVSIQGGDPSVIDNPDKLPQAKHHLEIKTQKNGYISCIKAEDIGVSAMLLGAGRKKKDDVIDFAAGISIIKKVGEKVNIGDTLCILHTNFNNCEEAKEIAASAFEINDIKPEPTKYIYEIIK